MGEAKRRKKLDSTFGKHSISIEKSPITDNWLIILDDCTFDSAINYDDAEKVACWLKTQLEEDPLPHNFSSQKLKKWMSRNAHKCPDVPAQMFACDESTKQIKATFISNVEGMGEIVESVRSSG